MCSVCITKRFSVAVAVNRRNIFKGGGEVGGGEAFQSGVNQQRHLQRVLRRTVSFFHSSTLVAFLHEGQCLLLTLVYLPTCTYYREFYWAPLYLLSRPKNLSTICYCSKTEEFRCFLNPHRTDFGSKLQNFKFMTFRPSSKASFLRAYRQPSLAMLAFDSTQSRLKSIEMMKQRVLTTLATWPIRKLFQPSLTSLGVDGTI